MQIIMLVFYKNLPILNTHLKVLCRYVYIILNFYSRLVSFRVFDAQFRFIDSFVYSFVLLSTYLFI